MVNSSESNQNPFHNKRPIMKKLIYLSLFFTSTVSFAQTEVVQIQETLLKYLNGSSYSEPEIIQEAFYQEAELFLSKKIKKSGFYHQRNMLPFLKIVKKENLMVGKEKF